MPLHFDANPCFSTSGQFSSYPFLAAAFRCQPVHCCALSRRFRSFPCLLSSIPSYAFTYPIRSFPFLDVAAHLLSTALHSLLCISNAYQSTLHTAVPFRFLSYHCLFNTVPGRSSPRPIVSNPISAFSFLGRASPFRCAAVPFHSKARRHLSAPFPIIACLSFSTAHPFRTVLVQSLQFFAISIQASAFPWQFPASLFFSLTVQGRSTLCRFLSTISVPFLSFATQAFSQHCRFLSVRSAPIPIQSISIQGGRFISFLFLLVPAQSLCIPPLCHPIPCNSLSRLTIAFPARCLSFAAFPFQ